MLKTAGILLIFAVCTGMGFQQAEKLRERVTLIREILAFWGQFQVQLRGLRASPGDIVRLLRRQTAFCRNCLVVELDKAFGEGYDFGRNLEEALSRCPELKECGVSDILRTLEDVIGFRDLETQMVTLDSVQALLSVRLEEEENRLRRYGGLYRRLGVLGGMAVVVLLL